jgi:hypothetical protein
MATRRPYGRRRGLARGIDRSERHIDGPAPVPHCGGERVDLVRQAGSVTYTVLEPDHALASNATLTGTYDC